ncbi:MAG: hypothetical protein J6Z45_02480 [Oscillospiraceae bacterium]|nr:hypothetical protein [Oscillospiraceae bacterium]
MRLRVPAAVLFTAAAGCFLTGITAQAADGDRQGWVTEHDRRYYLDEEGNPLTGEQVIDGVPYLFAPNGAQQTGWQTVDGKRYFYGRDGEAQFGWINWRAGEYYVDPEQGKHTGRLSADGGIYLFDSYGTMQVNWIRTEDGKWCYAGESAMLASGETDIGGIPYLFDADNYLLTGWQTPSDGIRRFYGAETHSPETGFVTDPESGETSYVSDDFSLLTGLQEIEGRLYFFDEAGVMQTGFHEAGDSIYYFNPDGGEAMRGIREIDGKTYAFDDESYVRLTGLVEKSGVLRCFGEDGVMLTEAWYRGEEDSYYFDADGRGANGSRTLDGDIYAFSGGKMLRNIFTGSSEGVRWYGNDGKMRIGTAVINGSSYLFGEDGLMLTGWQETEEGMRWYAEDGKMASGPVTIDGEFIILADSGLRAKGAYTAPDGRQYYCKEPGVPVTGWFTADGKTCHYGEDGVKTVSKTVDGYIIDAGGTARTQNAVDADGIIKSAGTKPTDLFTKFVARFRYSRIEKTRTYQTLRAAGWEKLLDYLFAENKGVCYYLAAGFDFVCQRAGWETLIIHANHDTGDHYWVQVKVNGAWQNYDPTYKARNNISLSEILKLGNYHVLGFVTVRYDDRGTLASELYQENK